MNETIQYSVGDLTDAVNEEIQQWQKENKVARLRQRDATLWTNTDESQWMGWLDNVMDVNQISRINKLAANIKAAAFTDMVLLGMGGSSLCPAMLAITFGKIADFPALHILDSTDPQQIRRLEQKINLEKTLFIVSSKSGSTLEPTIFKDYFYNRLLTLFDAKEVGKRFLAITDPGTALEKVAKNDGFLDVFYGVPSVGGRYSALTDFGMVPAALMGLNIQKFLEPAEALCKQTLSNTSVETNSSVLLGIILGVSAKHGKDKVTFIISPGIHALGAWLEQLLAESTGKEGKGLIPVDQEALGTPDEYGQDRVFVYIRLAADFLPTDDIAVQKLEQAGSVVVKLTVTDKMQLAAELLRWEIATAVAGSVLGINPFNQPDVEASKTLTSQLTKQYEQTHQFSAPTPFFSDGDMALFSDEKNITDFNDKLVGEASIVGYLRAHLNRMRPGDYINLSAFIEMSDEHLALLQESRLLIRNQRNMATCLGFGPRFLHSTGQAYKGGPNTGIFLQITADHEEDLAIPGRLATFGLVIKAQAQGDFSVLAQRSRRILRIHLSKKVSHGLTQLRDYIEDALRID